MQKVQVQAEVDVKSFLSQFGTMELEELQREIPALLARRRAVDKKAEETALLRRLNEECALPEKHWLRFNTLNEKKQQTELTSQEWKEFFRLVKEEERLRLKRILILGELAQLRGVSLDEIADALGVKAPDHAN